MEKNIRIKNHIIPQLVTNGPRSHFFGYYDKCPWDSTESRILGLETEPVDRLPNENDSVLLGFADLKNNRPFAAFSETRAWNWQQGSMLQWLPPANDRFVIFNDRQDDRFVSVIFDLETKERKILPLPVYSVSANGRYAVTLNFSRIFNLRDAYGYAGVPDPGEKDNVPEKDGVFLLDLKTGDQRLIISLRQLFEYKHISSMNGGHHWVDHLMFNSDGSRFCFLHRWELADGGLYMRLFSANFDGTGLHCLLDSGNFSHFGWRNPQELLGWGRLPNQLNRIRKNRWLTKNILKPALPIYHFFVPDKSQFRRKIVNDFYLLFKDQGDNIKKISPDLLNEDGHCSWSPDGKWILTDTYPDENHFRTLILYDFENDRRFDIGRFYALPNGQIPGSGWDESGMRCDLHPRWNRQGNKICIDSVHEGSRQMYVLDVTEIINKK